MARDATADSAAAPGAGRAWSTGVVLAALTALGAVLRLVGLDRQSLWNDELSGWVQYTMPSLPKVFFLYVPLDHVPGYWMLMHVWTRVFGDSPTALRLPSALLGTATIPAMFTLGRRWYGRREGLIAAGITAVAWMPVYCSQEARP